jgi:outer membrane lipoprotein carrier protein
MLWCTMPAMNASRGQAGAPGTGWTGRRGLFAAAAAALGCALGPVSVEARGPWALIPAAPAQAEAPASEMAARLQVHYDGVRDFSADFTHTYEGGILRKKTTERGTVLIKKPGKMRWAYSAPEEKLFVSDGRKMYAWVPADRQVTVTSLPSSDEPATPLLFLLGRGNLTRDFDVTRASAVSGAPADAYALQLVPKRRVPDYESLTVVVDRGSLGLRMLVARDGQAGTSTFTFTSLKENIGVPDSKFTFTIPRGAAIVQGS